MGLRETPYSYFCSRIGQCHETWYMLLRRNSDPKQRSTNMGTFSKYFSEIQESIDNTWIITTDVVMQFKDIANFKAFRHNMWIQVHRDLGKEWLQLRYYVMEEDIEMAMRYFPDNWKIPFLTQEVPKGTEVDTGKTKTPTGDKFVPKRLKPMQKSEQQKKGGASNKDAHAGNKDISLQQKEQGAGDT